MRRRQNLGVFAVEFRFFLSLFLFHSSVLKPNFDLSLVEAQSRRDFDPSSSSQVFVEVKFLFQFRQLFIREIRTSQVVIVVGVIVIVVVGIDAVVVVVDTDAVVVVSDAVVGVVDAIDGAVGRRSAIDA